MYLPFALIITSIFTFFNLLIIPIGYATHILRLLTSMIKQPTLLDMFLRLILTIQFAIYGLFYFPVSLVVDMFVFFVNLYTEAQRDSLNDKNAIKFSREGLNLFEESLDEILYDLEQKKTVLMKKKEDMSQITTQNGGLLMEMTGVIIIL